MLEFVLGLGKLAGIIASAATGITTAVVAIRKLWKAIEEWKEGKRPPDTSTTNPRASAEQQLRRYVVPAPKPTTDAEKVGMLLAEYLLVAPIIATLPRSHDEVRKALGTIEKQLREFETKLGVSLVPEARAEAAQLAIGFPDDPAHIGIWLRSIHEKICDDFPRRLGTLPEGKERRRLFKSGARQQLLSLVSSLRTTLSPDFSEALLTALANIERMLELEVGVFSSEFVDVQKQAPIIDTAKIAEAIKDMVMDKTLDELRKNNDQKRTEHADALQRQYEHRLDAEKRLSKEAKSGLEERTKELKHDLSVARWQARLWQALSILAVFALIVHFFLK